MSLLACVNTDWEFIALEPRALKLAGQGLTDELPHEVSRTKHEGDGEGESVTMHLYAIQSYLVFRDDPPTLVDGRFNHLVLCGRIQPEGDTACAGIEMKSVPSQGLRTLDDEQTTGNHPLLRSNSDLEIKLEAGTASESTSKLRYAEFAALVDESQTNEKIVQRIMDGKLTLPLHSGQREDLDSPPVSSIHANRQNHGTRSGSATGGINLLGPSLQTPSTHGQRDKKTGTPKRGTAATSTQTDLNCEFSVVELAKLPLYAMHCPRADCRRPLHRVTFETQPTGKHAQCKHNSPRFVIRRHEGYCGLRSQVQQVQPNAQSRPREHSIYSALVNAVSLCWTDSTASSPVGGSQALPPVSVRRRSGPTSQPVELRAVSQHTPAATFARDSTECDGYCGESEDECATGLRGARAASDVRISETLRSI